MSEYKTYLCDICGKQEAQRLEFDVDYEDDPTDGKRSTVHGYTDLCHPHAIAFLQIRIKALPMEDQRRIWKEIVRSNRNV